MYRRIASVASSFYGKLSVPALTALPIERALDTLGRSENDRSGSFASEQDRSSVKNWGLRRLDGKEASPFGTNRPAVLTDK